MKNDSTKLNKPSDNQGGSAPDRQRAREAGQASQEQQAMSDGTSALSAKNTKQQGGAPQSAGGQQQASTSNHSIDTDNKERQTSPARDQGNSAPGASNKESQRQKGENP